MSQFPSGYNIEKYFLGHTEAVQSIMLLRNDTLLVSVSEVSLLLLLNYPSVQFNNSLLNYLTKLLHLNYMYFR